MQRIFSSKSILICNNFLEKHMSVRRNISISHPYNISINRLLSNCLTWAFGQTSRDMFFEWLKDILFADSLTQECASVYIYVCVFTWYFACYASVCRKGTMIKVSKNDLWAIAYFRLSLQSSQKGICLELLFYLCLIKEFVYIYVCACVFFLF